MHQDNRHILWEPGDHPAVELLRQYHEDILPPALQHQLERHLLGCDLCSDVLEGMALTNAAETEAAVKSINHQITARARQKNKEPLPVYFTSWRVAAAIILALCSTILVFYYNYNKVKQDQTIAVAAAEKAVREALKPAEEAVTIVPESIADVTPDTASTAAIAAVKPAPPKPTQRLTVPQQVPDELILQDQVQEPESGKVIAETLPLADAPAVAKATESMAPAQALSYQSRSALVPENTSVEKALTGKAAGVTIRGRSSIGMKQVQGQVLSEDGQPLPGVAVTIKGTSNGVATDANGNFTIITPNDNATLAFSYIGYERVEKGVDASTQNLTVNLHPDTRSLSEVVVTGYGSVKPQPPVIKDAKPVAGARAYRKYLEENIRYTSASEKGRVVVRATVSPEGKLENPQVVKSLCPSCDAEAVRLVKEGPLWQPATSNGTNIVQNVKITVRFKPQNKN
ncbi:TonB family protein [uncultured Pontibacter sp.]|uniref:TonB family protein n=1 Tax=uncultured Pontibacter sp. TaxID=453356 RepID=UPI002628FFBC|nr:TonB family protein [uncultured Pontibacter sp.]